MGWCLALVLSLVAGCKDSTPSRPVTTASAKVTPLLQASEPVRRLATSDFRLSQRGGSNRRPFRFSPDGKRLAGANWDEVKVWSFPEGKPLHDFTEEIDSNCIGFSADGSQLLAFEQRQNSIFRFDLSTGVLKSKTPIANVVEDQGATYYHFSPDGRWLVSTEEYEHVMVWDTSTGQRLFRKKLMHSHQAPVSKDGVLTLHDLFVDRYDITTGKKLSSFRLDGRRRPVSNAEGTLIASYSEAERAIVFWDPATDERVGGTIPCGKRNWRPQSAALSTDGRRFVYPAPAKPGDQLMGVFDVLTGEMISSFGPPSAQLYEESVISPDGRYVLPTADRSVFSPIDVQTGRAVREVPDHTGPIEVLSFTPDASTLLVGSRDQRRAWDVRSGQAGAAFEKWHHLPHVAAVDDQRAIVFGLRSGGWRLHDIASGRILQSFMEGTHAHLATFQLGSDRKTFVGLLDRTYHRWDVETGESIAEWTLPPLPYGSEMQVYGRYSFSGPVLGGSRLYRFDEVRPPKKRPDGSLNWGRIDLLLEDWTSQRVTNQVLIPYPDNFAVADTADERTLVLVTSDAWHPQAHRRVKNCMTYVITVDVATGFERLRIARPRTDYFSAFSMVAFSPDVRLLATGSNRNQIEIWNGFTGELIQRLKASNDLTRLRFSDDGSALASGHSDGTVYLWDMRRAWNSAVPRQKLTKEELQLCWSDLAGDGSQASAAMQRLLGDPRGAIEMLDRNMMPGNSSGVSQLISGWLESPTKESEAKILQSGPQAIDGLYEALGQGKSEQSTVDINRLINAATSPAGPTLRRRLLAIGLVEQVGSESARRVLARLAKGPEQAPESKAAAAALRRLASVAEMAY